MKTNRGSLRRKPIRDFVWTLAAVTALVGGPLWAVPFPAADPEEQGLSGPALAAVEALIEGYSDRDVVVGGSFLVIRNRQVVWSTAHGWQDREDRVAMRSDTLCNIRSMTKMITGAACQILVDEGRLSLSDPVARFVPGFDVPRSRAITVEQLLTHRSGLPLTILTSLDDYPTLLSIANAVGERGPDFTPGSRFWYSDAGTDALGAVVEVVCGTTLDRFVRTRLLEPLGMGDTYYLHESGVPRDRVASLYYGRPGSWTRIWTPDRPLYPYAMGSQSLYSTPEDYARFLGMLLDKGRSGDGQILSEAAVRRVLAPVSIMSSLGSTKPFPTGFPGTECHYGQMSILYESGGDVEAFGHSGSDGTWAWVWPERELTILYFTQSRGQSTGTRLETAFHRWLLHPTDHPSAETVARYEPYLGWYAADFESALGTFRGERFEVVLHEGRLGLDIPGQFILGLRDSTLEGRWVFDLESQVWLVFEHDGTGRVTGLRYYEPGQVFRLPRMEQTPPGPPALTGVAWIGVNPGDADDPACVFNLLGQPTFRYVVDCSEDLRAWSPLRTNLLGGCRLEIADPFQDFAARRFYRARAEASP